MSVDDNISTTDSGIMGGENPQMNEMKTVAGYLPRADHKKIKVTVNGRETEVYGGRSPLYTDQGLSVEL